MPHTDGLCGAYWLHFLEKRLVQNSTQVSATLNDFSARPGVAESTDVVRYLSLGRLRLSWLSGCQENTSS